MIPWVPGQATCIVGTGLYNRTLEWEREATIWIKPYFLGPHRLLVLLTLAHLELG